MTDRQSHKRKYDNSMPIVDEGWWESVLADEQKYLSPRPKPAPVKQTALQSHTTESASVVEQPRVNWEVVKEIYKSDRIVLVQVTGYNRGGLLVEGEGIAGFIPFSHLIELTGIHIEQRENYLQTYQGKTLRVKVIECTPEEGRVVFSERAALAEPGKRVQLFHSLTKGAQVKGVVTNITDFGVFVDLGGVEGLIHISELSWGRVQHPSQIVKLGEEITVQVLDISSERCRVALSLKRLMPNPWELADTEFPVGQVKNAVITSLLSYGAFARLEIGVEGLIHASEMPLEAGQSPRDILKEGQHVQVRILHVDAAHQRLGLSMRLNHDSDPNRE